MQDHNVLSIASTAEVHVKCIFTSFSRHLHFRAFTIFSFIFLTSFLFVYTKMIENELKMGSKMARKWPENGYRERP